MNTFLTTLVALGCIYFFGGCAWAAIYLTEWSLHDNKATEEAREHARKFLCTPIWPVALTAHLQKAIGQMRESLIDREDAQDGR